MTEILKRNFAPISNEAWEEIDEAAIDILNGNLSARSLVDFIGPKGMEFAAINLGKSEKFKKSDLVENVEWSERKVRPLIEVKKSFKLKIEELDSISRGLKNPDLEPLEDASFDIATFEEKSIYHGFKKADIPGIISSSPNDPIVLGVNTEKYQEMIETAILTLQEQRIGGPYGLVLGTEAYKKLHQGDKRGYPLNKRIKDMIRGDVLWSPAVKGGVLISTRGGDYELTIGQDLSIGYIKHDSNEVELFLTESFTFEVLEPAAAVELTI